MAECDGQVDLKRQVNEFGSTQADGNCTSGQLERGSCAGDEVVEYR